MTATHTATRVERLTPARRDDFLQFFDRLRHTGREDCRAAGECCCHYFHVATAIAWDSLDARANRVAMTARIDVGEMDGFLAYAGERVVGWLNAQPSNKLLHLAARLGMVPIEHGDVPLHETAAIVCFVADPSHPQLETIRLLLDAALTSLQQRGLKWVDAFPRRLPGEPAHPNGGELELFLAAGFSMLRHEKDFAVVRRSLGPTLNDSAGGNTQ